MGENKIIMGLNRENLSLTPLTRGCALGGEPREYNRMGALEGGNKQ